MTHSSDSSGASAQPNRSSADAAQLLQTGLAALKQRNYAAAIPCLEACQNSSEAAIRLKAQMGLVKAYARTDQVEAATKLCQPLCEHANLQVQSWARQTLSELTADAELSTELFISSTETPSPEAPEDLTGFVPLSEPRAAHSTEQFSDNRPGKISSNSAETSTDVESADATGFTPLTRPNAPSSKTRPTPNYSAATVSNREIEKQQFVGQPTTEQLHRHSQSHDQSHDQSLAAPIWRNAGRSSRWNSLGAVDASGLWALEAGSLVLLFWWCRALLRWLFGSLDFLSYQSNYLFGLPRILLPQDFTLTVLIGLVVLALLSPWLLDWLLQKVYRAQPFSLVKLEASSPEAGRLIKRVCKQHPPTLYQLPSSAPLIFTYGYLPHQVRLVVSQALLNQLNDDEISALVAAELAHIRYWDFGVMSLMLLVTQLPYLVYWYVADWGNRQQDRVLQTVAAGISILGYGLFWLLRLPGLLLSRVRLFYSDRLAAELTGNPNGLSRALLKLTIGTAQTIQQQKQTDALLESFEMLLPVGYRQAITLGSLYRGDASVLEWERNSPYRRWLSLPLTHPPLGERLNLLTRYAQHWQLESELDWRESSHRRIDPLRLLLQGAPFFGIPFGMAAAVVLWGLGRLARQWRWFELAWLAEDPSVLLACCLLGFSIGMFLRINRFFPDIKRDTVQVEPMLAELLTDPDALPLDSQPIRLQGTLIGRPGFQNWLYRDLLLQTPSGLIRLHYTSRLGWIGDLFPESTRPTRLIGRAVTVSGWFRRGATPWIDVDLIQTQYGTAARSYHPIWSTVLATVAALLAVYLLLQGE
jgi:Zn-dependent protease with chaperone function